MSERQELGGGSELARVAQDVARGPAPEVWDEARETALVERILRTTTGEDLSWRGELSLVGSFVRERLAASFWLRVLAASLALHLAAAPVVGWWLSRSEEETPLRIGFQPAPSVDPPAQEARAPVPRVEDPALSVGAWGPGPDPARIENVLRRDRYLLSRASLPAARDVPDSAPLEIRLLTLRSRCLGEWTWKPWIEESQVLESGGTLALALFAELCLDRLACEGQSSGACGTTLSRLAGFLDAHPEDPSSPLARHVLDRARAYGAWPAPPGFDPLALSEPLGPEFRAVLRMALGDHDPDSALIRAWIGESAR